MHSIYAFAQVIADDAGWVKAVRTRNSQSGAVEDLPCGLLIYSLGYENVLLDGVPKNDDGRIKMRDSVRVHTNGETLVYACGWCAHAPRGTISDTQVTPNTSFYTWSVVLRRIETGGGEGRSYTLT